MITDVAAVLLFAVAAAAVAMAARLQEPPLLTPEPGPWRTRRRRHEEAVRREADKFIAALRAPEPRPAGRHRLTANTTHRKSAPRRGTGQTNTTHYSGGAGAPSIGGAGGTGINRAWLLRSEGVTLISAAAAAEMARTSR